MLLTPGSVFAESDSAEGNLLLDEEVGVLEEEGHVSNCNGGVSVVHDNDWGLKCNGGIGDSEGRVVSEGVGNTGWSSVGTWDGVGRVGGTISMSASVVWNSSVFSMFSRRTDPIEAVLSAMSGISADFCLSWIHSSRVFCNLSSISQVLLNVSYLKTKVKIVFKIKMCLLFVRTFSSRICKDL